MCARVVPYPGLLAAGALTLAPPALADDGVSSNWAGYAVHGAGFHSVWASWRQPGVSCARGQTAYSAYWVGLGGYSSGSQALEQIGTEADCRNGRPVLSAWFEMVPAASVPVSLPVSVGDDITAPGHRVRAPRDARALGRDPAAQLPHRGLVGPDRRHLGRMDRRGALGLR